MARKKPEPMQTAETETKFVRLELPIDIHIKFRVAAAKKGATMATMARRLVEEFLAKEEQQ